MPAPSSNHAVTRVPIVYKRIRINDSDDNPSPVKRQATNSNSLVGVNVQGTPPPHLELTIADKERRFRNMLEIFPEISPTFIKNTLLKHNWNEERSRDELLKHDPESDDISTSAASFFGSQPGFFGNNGSSLMVTSGPPAHLELTIADKERRFRNMLEIFPEISSVTFIKNTLLKHNWNEERSRDELLKHDPESDDISTSAASFFGSRPGFSGNNGSSLKVTSGPPAHLELTIADKERWLDNMLEMFPEISPTFINNTLLKHNWNKERSLDELLKHDPESDDISTSAASFFGSQPGFSGNNGSSLKVTSGPPAHLELTIADKERWLDNMLEMFPEISPTFINNTLLKHNWNKERSLDELLKHDPESDDISTSAASFFGSRPGFSGNNGSTAQSGSSTSKPSTEITLESIKSLLQSELQLFMNDCVFLDGVRTVIRPELQRFIDERLSSLISKILSEQLASTFQAALGDLKQRVLSLENNRDKTEQEPEVVKTAEVEYSAVVRASGATKKTAKGKPSTSNKEKRASTSTPVVSTEQDKRDAQRLATHNVVSAVEQGPVETRTTNNDTTSADPIIPDQTNKKYTTRSGRTVRFKDRLDL